MSNVEPFAQAAGPTAICERLKQVRVQVCGPRGQSHFAGLLNLSPSTYNYYEKGRIPPVDVLDRASRVAAVPLLWLIRGEPEDFDVHGLRRIEAPPRAEAPPGQPDALEELSSSSNGSMPPTGP